mmetsp:Transcript_96737/g.273291  ORF Transcript_96737/g.273291 Transcript_96737/m.273291 type:complete len:219 (+) Transcript_96737:1977-2633(+)
MPGVENTAVLGENEKTRGDPPREGWSLRIDAARHKPSVILNSADDACDGPEEVKLGFSCAAPPIVSHLQSSVDGPENLSEALRGGLLGARNLAEPCVQCFRGLCHAPRDVLAEGPEGSDDLLLLVFLELRKVLHKTLKVPPSLWRADVCRPAHTERLQLPEDLINVESLCPPAVDVQLRKQAAQLSRALRRGAYGGAGRHGRNPCQGPAKQNGGPASG